MSLTAGVTLAHQQALHRALGSILTPFETPSLPASFPKPIECHHGRQHLQSSSRRACVSDTHIPAPCGSNPNVPQKKPYGGVSPSCGKRLVAVDPDRAGEAAVMGYPSLRARGSRAEPAGLPGKEIPALGELQIIAGG